MSAKLSNLGELSKVLTQKEKRDTGGFSALQNSSKPGWVAQINHSSRTHIF
jgi:hypothetical protein